MARYLSCLAGWVIRAPLRIGGFTSFSISSRERQFLREYVLIHALPQDIVPNDPLLMNFDNYDLFPPPLFFFSLLSFFIRGFLPPFLLHLSTYSLTFVWFHSPSPLPGDLPLSSIIRTRSHNGPNGALGGKGRAGESKVGGGVWERRCSIAHVTAYPESNQWHEDLFSQNWNGI